MVDHVEVPLRERFKGKPKDLMLAAAKIGGTDRTGNDNSADVAVFFQPLPRIPVMVMFWDGDEEDGFDAEAKLMFDETIMDHLDIEAVMFLSERLCELLIS
jgi:hypothetical protein